MTTRLGRRLTVVTCAFIVTLLSISGCNAPQRIDRTAPQVEELLVSVVSTSADQLDVSEWEQRGGRPRPSPCSQPHTSHFTWTIKAAPGDEPLSDAEKMKAYWEGLGMQARLVTGSRPAVYASGGDVTAIAFNTDAHSYTISGSSLCADGNPADLDDRPSITPAPTPE